MVVQKEDNTFRTCGNSKSAINPSVEDQEYVLPTTWDLYPSLVRSKVFSELNLSYAYA